jgi:SAM-dependent methyltransferase
MMVMGASIDADAFNAFEAAGWEQRATSYHRSLGQLTGRAIGPLLDAAEVRPGMRVLDVATGPGQAAAAGAARGATAVGVDIAHEMVVLARSLHPDVTFVAGDGERLDFADGSFEAVVGNFAILHFGRPERAAAEFARVLVPGGRVALSTWDDPGTGRLPGLFFDAVAEVGATPPPDVPPGPPFFRFADPAEFTRLLTGAGLTDVSVRTVAFTYRFVGSLYDCLLEGTVRARALVHGQPEPTQARIRAVLDRLSREYATPDGALDLPVSVKIASGRRP